MDDFSINGADILIGDCIDRLKSIPHGSVQTCITSPPYYALRDYDADGQIGLEQTPEQYIDRMVQVFRAVRDVLAEDGTLWINIGDSYATSGGPPTTVKNDRTPAGWTNRAQDYRTKPTGLIKPKDLMGMPWMLAFALRADGWYLRQDIIWNKPNPMPESVRDRCTKAHEYIFLLSKSARYFYDHEAIKEDAKGVQSGTGVGWNTVAEADPRDKRGKEKGRSKRDTFKREDSKRAAVIPGQAIGTHRPDREDSSYDITKRNKRSVWNVATKAYKGAHFATYPPELIEPCILAGSRVGDTVLDPFNGSGTTGQVAIENGRNYIGIELNPEYAELTRKRLMQVSYQHTLDL